MATDPSVLMEIIRAQTEIAKLGLDLGGVVTFVAERVQQLTGADGAVVELAEGDEMIFQAAAGMAKPQLGMRLKRSGSLSGLCVDLDRALRCDDFEIDDRVDHAAGALIGLRSMVVAPLVHSGSTVGVLSICSPRAYAFSDQDVRVLELMSELIAAAMFHAVKYETSALYHQATHDALTGLANRALFYDRLRQNLAFARRQLSPLAVLNLDMDGLKPINDRHGHRIGDAAIRETASRIRRASRQSDTVARLGGDEFGVILPEILSRETAVSLANRIAEEISQPFRVGDSTVELGASIGVAFFPEDGAEVDVLIETADQSMYEMKRTRKHR